MLTINFERKTKKVFLLVFVPLYERFKRLFNVRMSKRNVVVFQKAIFVCLVRLFLLAGWIKFSLCPKT